MAVKVRCPKCSKVLNAPDAARGKAVKCPACESKVPVPNDDNESGGSPRPATKAAPAKAAAGKAKVKAARSADDDFLAALDLEAVEDENIRLCPKCGAHLQPEDDECPECGVDTRTGQLSARKKRKLSQKGPDSALFWGAAWSESWEFLKENWRVPIKLATMLSVFAMISIISIFCLVKYCDPINSPPPAMFWGGLAIFFGLGIYGMPATIMQQIVIHSMENRDKDYKAQFDMFAALANGLKYIVWSILLPLPFFFTGVIFLLPMLCFPIAVVHMTRPYPHPAWIPWDMLRITVKNLGPCLYILMMGLLLLLPAYAFSAIVSIMAQPVAKLFAEWAFYLAGQLAGLLGDSSDTGLLFQAVQLLVVLALSFLLMWPTYLVISFPMVFMMRTIGEFGYYFKSNLDLVNRIPKHQLAGFWPRYLAYLIDALLTLLLVAGVVAVDLGILWGYSYLNGVSFTEFVVSPLGHTIDVIFTFLAAAAVFWYFASSESSAVQGTLGMRAIGLKVIDLKGNRIKFGTGLYRHFVRGIGGAFFFIGWIACAFTEKKQTLHDMASKTLVVWEGD